MRPAGRRHMVLVGLPGAGKTVTGRAAAMLLKTRFTDLDQRIEQRTGQSIAAIFSTRGESGFRELERAAMHEALAIEPHVIAAGGGWAAEPGNLETAIGSAVVVWLEVSPDVAAQRLQHSGTAGTRPLLAGAERARLQDLLVAREPFYRRAALALNTDCQHPGEVAQAVAALARAHAGW